MSKIRIDKNDVNRILLTELLPYEVPMLFSNDGLYKIVSSNGHNYFFSRIRHKGHGIPFNYEITKSNNSDTRCLSVIHPLNQLEFIDFYKKYDSIIIHQCSKSPVSLRKIQGVARYCYSPSLVIEEDEDQNREVEVEPEVRYFESKIYKSYFVYKPIDLIYKFYERNEFQRLEQRFNFLWEFDISKCFYHIYSHSITWAVKDKESAKKNIRMKSFENSFDKLMQHANYNETNGIVVGPEVSRIFAEIILQEIDLRVLKSLDEKGIKFGFHYEVRRYVDDYFVFSNEEKILESVLKAYKKELEYFKLYLNSGKTVKRNTPFITNITVGKMQAKKLVDQLFEKCIELYEDKVDEYKQQKKLRAIRSPYSESKYFIKDFQCIVRSNDLTYDILNKDIVRFLKAGLVGILKNKNLTIEKQALENFLLMYLDIAFYCYSLNINASGTFKIAQIIVFIVKFLDNKDEDIKHTIYSKIARESEFVMTTYHRKIKTNETNIEILNLLISIKKLGKGYLITEKKIREYFNLDDNNNSDFEVNKYNKLNYFHIITLLYYFEDNPLYEELKTNIEQITIYKFQNEVAPFDKAEFTCLFFDFICCPFVSADSKREVVKLSGYDAANAEREIAKIEERKMWFMSWDPEIDLERVLKKKEWTPSY